jgi:hypothetical protein
LRYGWTSPGLALILLLVPGRAHLHTVRSSPLLNLCLTSVPKRKMWIYTAGYVSSSAVEQ